MHTIASTAQLDAASRPSGIRGAVLKMVCEMCRFSREATEVDQIETMRRSCASRTLQGLRLRQSCIAESTRELLGAGEEEARGNLLGSRDADAGRQSIYHYSVERAR